MQPSRTSTRIRVLSMALAAAVSTALLATIVGSMPPDFAGPPNDARNTRGVAFTEVAGAPLRMEVFGTRSEDTAVVNVPAARPRS